MDGYVTIGTDLDLKGLEQKLDQMSAMLEKKAVAAADNASAKSSKRFTAAFALGVSALSSVMTKVMSKVSEAMSGAISRVDTLENFPKVMGSLGINTNVAANAVNYLSEKLTGLPTTLDAGVSAVQQFTTVTNNVEVSTKMFLALNNALLASGSSMQQQQSALYALTNAYARGYPYMDEWNQAMVTMPAQMKQVSDVMGYAGPDKLYEALKKGQVSLNDFMKTLIEMNEMDIGPYESLEKQAREGTKGIATSIANLKTAVVRGVADVLKTIGQENISNFFNNIISMIKAVIPYITAFVKTFVSAVNIIAKVIASIRNFFGNLFGKKDAKKTETTVNDVGVSFDGLGASVDGVGGSMDKTRGSAKKLAKELGNLQKFDEMNVLQDNTSSSGAGGGASGGGGAGDFGGLGDLANMDFGLDKLNGKLVELGKAAEVVSAAIWGIVAAWAAWKISKILKNLGLLKEALSLTQRAGIALFVAGLILLIKNLAETARNWENLNTVQKLARASISTLMGALSGLAAALVLGVSGPIGALVGAIVGLIAWIGTAIYKTNEYKDSTKQLKNAKEELRKAHEDLTNSMKSYADAVDLAEDKERILKDLEAEHNIVGKKLYKSVKDGTLKYEDMTKAQREVYKAYLDNKDAQKKLREEREKNNKAISDEKTKVDELSAAYVVNKGKMDENFKKLYKNWQDGKLSSDDFKEHIFKMLNGIDKSHRQTFVENLPDDVKQAFGPDSKGREYVMQFDDGTKLAYKDIRDASKKTKDQVKSDTESAFGADSKNKAKNFGKDTKGVFDDIGSKSSTKMKGVKSDINGALDKNNYSSTGNKLKNWWNSLIGSLTTNIGLSVSATGSALIAKVTGKRAAKGAIVTYPKLAVGGIVNRPGRGVPIGGAIAGERGAEGVIPLTDSQQMALLGEAIGRYITVNANITNTMNGRVISRELQKVQNESDFAFNR